MDKGTNIFGIDLGTTYSCIAYVDEYGKAEVIPNSEGDRTTPSVVQFEGTNRVVGKEAKNSAVLYPDAVAELVKRHMGEADWRFEYEGEQYTAEEISSYILRKLAEDAEQYLSKPVKDVVITCPAYFGIAQRDATANAGKIAGLNVLEVINEPTAAAIMYGLQKERDQVVLIYDLGGGTFDITVIEIKGGSIRVVATGGDHNLGGRNWDEEVVTYIAQKWQEENGTDSDPLDSSETLQDLWLQAEKAKMALTAKLETKVPVAHDGKRTGAILSREKFDEITAKWLDQTIMFTKSTIEEAKKRGFSHYDQILLVGGSTRMPQVMERLKAEFNLPMQIFDPDQAVAKGAATYASKLAIDQKIQYEIATMTGAAPEDVNIGDASPEVARKAKEKVARESGLRRDTVEKFSGMQITNVASHSFGIIALTRDDSSGQDKQIIANLVLVNDPIPVTQQQTFFTYTANQSEVELQIMENLIQEQTVDDPSMGEEIGKAELPLPPRLPAGSPIEVTFELYRDGRLHVTGHEPSSKKTIEATILTSQGASEEELDEAKARSVTLTIS